MASQEARILIVDDEQSVRIFCGDVLKKTGYAVDVASEGREALVLARQNHYDMVLTDIMMQPMDGIALTKKLKELDREQVVVLITGYPSIETAVKGIKEGAHDYLPKPFTPDGLRVVVAKALESRRLKEENKNLRSALQEQYAMGNIIGKSKAMQAVFETAKRVAPTESTVLITGQSGTGKELFARALHQLSLRQDRPFVTINCCSLVESLLESELFGHLRGAFTGASSRKRGLFWHADRGTIFMDEIGDLSPVLQPKLLRVLQEGEFMEVGGVEPVKVDVRVVAATNRDLREDVEKGTFREDLFYRLNVINLHLPSLAERSDDIPLLARHFVKKHAEKSGSPVNELSTEALKLLMSYNWPGNVRELENAIERAVILANGTCLEAGDFDEPIRPETREAEPALYPYEGMTLEEVERLHIERVLHQTDYNKSRTAEILGINRTTLWKKLRQGE